MSSAAHRFAVEHRLRITGLDNQNSYMAFLCCYIKLKIMYVINYIWLTNMILMSLPRSSFSEEIPRRKENNFQSYMNNNWTCLTNMILMSLPELSLSEEKPGRKENFQLPPTWITHMLNKYDINALTKIFFVRRSTWKKRKFMNNFILWNNL